ncbi:MAG: serine acetyltransferase [Sedimentisphaerales bacterium]
MPVSRLARIKFLIQPCGQDLNGHNHITTTGKRLMSMAKYIFQDWRRNNHDFKIRLVLLLFRTGQLLRKSRICRWTLFYPYYLFYKVLVFWFFHIELSLDLEVGSGLRIYHGYSLVIHPKTRIGRNVTLRHCTTLGNKGQGGGAPLIEDGVEIGCGVIIIGEITIGECAKIGAGAVVTKDVPPNSVVIGNPAQILRR